ncbi:MAG: hypothetical protein M3264_01025 [Thermoproteota archaeon]|nr:hypothetical protein [Thermoproteota archaeon]
MSTLRFLPGALKGTIEEKSRLTTYIKFSCRQRGYYEPVPCLAFPLYHNNDLR